jgi:hypothetical protein
MFRLQKRNDEKTAHWASTNSKETEHPKYSPARTELRAALHFEWNRSIAAEPRCFDQKERILPQNAERPYLRKCARYKYFHHRFFDKIFVDPAVQLFNVRMRCPVPIYRLILHPLGLATKILNTGTKSAPNQDTSGGCFSSQDSPADQSRCPGEAAAHGFNHHEVALLNPAIATRHRESKWN